MKHITLVALSAALICTGCKQGSKPSAKPDASQDNEAIKDPSWVKVSWNNDEKSIYVNDNSIWPYGDKIRVEVARETEKDKFDGMVMAFDCKKRLSSQLGTDGAVGADAPVVSWQIFAHIYNYACFKQVIPKFANEPRRANLDITTTEGV